jgi:Flp pilus assembly protein TadD
LAWSGFSRRVRLEGWLARQPPRWAVPLLLPGVVAFLLYLPALHGGLVWDDPLFLNHPLYRDPANWAQALAQPFLLSPNYYRPAAVATLLLGGDSPATQHLFNALLHALNTALVALLAARLAGYGRGGSRARVVGMGAGLLYGAQPALVEGVAFIAGRFDLLLTTFTLLALVADHALRGRRWLRPFAVGVAVLGAALSKEMAAAFVLVLPLWHLGSRAFASSDGADSSEVPQTSRRSRLGWLGPDPAETASVYLAAGLGLLGYLALRYAALGYLYLPESGRALAVGSPWQHVLLVGRSLAEYVRLTLWPFTTLRPIHYSPLPVPGGSAGAWLPPIAGVALLLGLAWWVRRDRATGALAAAGVVALLPVLNVVPLELGGGAFVAERFLLFPLALLALAASRLARRFEFRTLAPLVGLWVVAGVAVVQLTVPHWRSDRTLWEWGVRRAPRSPTPYTNLALVAINQGDAGRGLALAEQALQRDPNEDNAHNHRGLALFRLGRYAEAEAAFARAVELAPQNPLYWSNLAGALRDQDKLGEAERLLLDEALRLDPELGVAHFNLGLVYLKADRPDLAARALSRALELLPPVQGAEVQAFLDQTADPQRWLRFADLLLSNGEADSALQAFAQAEQQGAAPLDVAVGRSAALITLEELDQAEALLQAALLSAPEDARLYNNVGLIAQIRGQMEQAQALFARAADLAPGWELPRQNLEALRP